MMPVLRFLAGAVAVVTLAIMLTADHSVPFVIADCAIVLLLSAAAILPRQALLMAFGFALATVVFAVAFAVSLDEDAANIRVAAGFVVTVPALAATLWVRARSGRRPRPSEVTAA